MILNKPSSTNWPHLYRNQWPHLSRNYWYTIEQNIHLYFGYKIHLVTSVTGVSHPIDLTKASVHDIHFLNGVKYPGLNNCTLIGENGYLFKTYQTDLFNTARISLKTPMRNNQHRKKRFEPVFRRFRKRIETLFAQLCDQFMLKRNYAKSLAGLSV